eukprot:SAG25_NODE_7464_length_479_cov_0.755263_1_plen_79_part_01
MGNTPSVAHCAWAESPPTVTSIPTDLDPALLASLGCAPITHSPGGAAPSPSPFVPHARSPHTGAALQADARGGRGVGRR